MDNEIQNFLYIQSVVWIRLVKIGILCSMQKIGYQTIHMYLADNTFTTIFCLMKGRLPLQTYQKSISTLSSIVAIFYIWIAFSKCQLSDHGKSMLLIKFIPWSMYVYLHWIAVKVYYFVMFWYDRRTF